MYNDQNLRWSRACNPIIRTLTAVLLSVGNPPQPLIKLSREVKESDSAFMWLNLRPYFSKSNGVNCVNSDILLAGILALSFSGSSIVDCYRWDFCLLLCCTMHHLPFLVCSLNMLCSNHCDTEVLSMRFSQHEAYGCLDWPASTLRIYKTLGMSPTAAFAASSSNDSLQV